MPKRNGPMNLADVKVVYWQACIYGGPGVGKTVFAASSNKMRTFVFDVDNGINSANAYLTKHGMDKSRVHPWPVEEVNDFYEGYDWLVRHIKEYDVVVIDTATELQRLMLREVMEKNKHAAADQRDWGAILTMAENVTAKFRHMPTNVIYVAHEMAKSEIEDGPQLIRPSFQGAFGREYAKHFGVIGRMILTNQKVKNKDTGTDEQKLVRAINFGPDPTCHSKDRSGNLDKWMKPDIDEVFDRLNAAVIVGASDAE